MPAPLKPTRRVRKLPQTPGGVAKTRSRGPPPKLPPRASIVSAAAPAAATPIPPSVEEEGRRKAGGYNGGAGAGAGTSSTDAGAATVANPISTSISAVKPISIQQQRQSSPANAASTAMSTTPRLNKRQMAVATLVAAEQAYGKRIALLETVFGKIARTPDAFAPLRDLLLTAPPLVDVCNTLIAELAPKVSPTSTSKIGNLFCAHASRLAVFSAFCGQVEAATLALQESVEDGTPIFLMVEECEGDPRCENLSFVQCCWLPRQHLSQYVSRLETVLAVTPEDHPDYNPVSEAIERVGVAVAQVSAESQHLATLLNVLRVQARMPGTDLAGLRAAPEMLLKEGPLEWRGTSRSSRSRSGAGAVPEPACSAAKLRKLHLFLFSNRLIVATPKPGVRANGERAYVAVDPAQLGKDADPAVMRRSWGGTAGVTKVGVLDGVVSGWKLKGKAFMLAHDFEEIRPDRQVLMELHAQDEAAAAEWLAALSKMA